MMNLNNVVKYWLDCIRNEDILGKGISPLSRSKALIYPFPKDSFIFNSEQVESGNTKISDFYTYSETKEYEVFYGYPIYYYYDRKQEKKLFAPIFIVQVILGKVGGKITISRNDSLPSCGIQVLEEFGLKSEQVSDLNKKIEEIFKSGEIKDIVDKIMSIYSEEITANIVEKIDPAKLTNNEKISKSSPYGIYNKSVLFVGDSSSYNMHLLADLIDLSEKGNLNDTALSYLNGDVTKTESNCFLPVFPYPINEYQISAIESCCKHKLSVITGPPGTGKSQFIANLIISLFMAGKKVLFVSHTGEAVDVVNTKLNDYFENLMIRTGKKELRQELRGKFANLLRSKANDNTQSSNELINHWSLIRGNHNLLNERYKLDREYTSLFFVKKELTDLLNSGGLINRFIRKIKYLFINIKINSVDRRLRQLPELNEIENKIIILYSEYFIKSKKFVAENYINKMIGDGFYIDEANEFIDGASSIQRPGMEYYKPIGGLEILRVWSCTLKSLRATFDLKPNMFDYVIFDEASQIDLPSAAPALYRAKNAVVVGDPNQLTHIATITLDQDEIIARKNDLAKENRYKSRLRYCDVSLYKSAENSIKHLPVFLLNHYRSEDSIIELCNKTFYDGKLKIRTKLHKNSFPNKLQKGVHWVDIAGKSLKRNGGSRYNPEEATKVTNLLKKILTDAGDSTISIGVVTPYSAQQDLIYKLVSKSISSNLIEKCDLKILTAHKFQGSEKDIMIFSPVLATEGDGNDDRWYNIYPQILNVALSRAKRLLYIVGDKNFCKEHICSAGDRCILKKLTKSLEEICNQAKQEKYNLDSKFDTPTEAYLYCALQKTKIDDMGYKIIPKYVAKRYTLDFAILKGNKKIDIECDGKQHEIVEGIPIVEDVERDEYLTNQGWTVLRFSNHKILSDTQSVISKITREVK